MLLKHVLLAAFVGSAIVLALPKPEAGRDPASLFVPFAERMLCTMTFGTMLDITIVLSLQYG